MQSDERGSESKKQGGNSHRNESSRQTDIDTFNITLKADFFVHQFHFQFIDL